MNRTRGRAARVAASSGVLFVSTISASRARSTTRAGAVRSNTARSPRRAIGSQELSPGLSVCPSRTTIRTRLLELASELLHGDGDDALELAAERASSQTPARIPRD